MASLHCVVKYPKTLAVTVIVLVLLSVGIYLLVRNESGSSEPKKAPTHVIVLSRHGEREPLLPIPGRDDFSPGELTEYGRDSMRFLGSQLRAEYAMFLEEANVQRVTYTGDARCRDSALAIADGMEAQGYVERSLPRLVLEDPEELAALTRSTGLIQLLGIFRQTLPPCVEQIANATYAQLKGSLKNGDLPENLQVLVGFLIADSVDTIRLQGGELPFNLTYAMDCLPKTTPLVDEKVFAALSHVCMKSFCRSVVESLLDELEAVRSGGSTPGFSIYGVSDVHVEGLMIAVKPERFPVRPLFGGHLVFEVSPSSVTINYGLEPRSERAHFKTVPLPQVLTILHSLVDSQVNI